MELKDLIGLKIIDVAEGANSDEWTVTLENKVRLVFEVAGVDDEAADEKTWCKNGHSFECKCCLDLPNITIDIQDYSGGLE